MGSAQDRDRDPLGARVDEAGIALIALVEEHLAVIVGALKRYPLGPMIADELSRALDVMSADFARARRRAWRRRLLPWWKPQDAFYLTLTADIQRVVAVVGGHLEMIVDALEEVPGGKALAVRLREADQAWEQAAQRFARDDAIHDGE
jgi:hypothetical protein